MVLVVQPPLSGSIYGGGKHGGRDRGTPPKARRENGSFPREMIGKKKAEGGGDLGAVPLCRSSPFVLSRLRCGKGGKHGETTFFARSRERGDMSSCGPETHFSSLPLFCLGKLLSQGSADSPLLLSHGERACVGGRTRQYMRGWADPSSSSMHFCCCRCLSLSSRGIWA